MDVKCVDNQPLDVDKKLWPDLTLGNVYIVIGIEGAYYRLMADLGKPYLYNKSRFEVVDPEKDKCWIKRVERKIGVMWYPEKFMDKGFFKSLFSGDPRAAFDVAVYMEAMFNRRKNKMEMRRRRKQIDRPLA